MVSYQRATTDSIVMTVSLNPCCNGRWSRTAMFDGFKRNVDTTVLILVVMEDGLVHGVQISNINGTISLNPCCNGRWSRTLNFQSSYAIMLVLILVVMEDGLVLDLIRPY